MIFHDLTLIYGLSVFSIMLLLGYFFKLGGGVISSVVVFLIIAVSANLSFYILYFFECDVSFFPLISFLTFISILFFLKKIGVEGGVEFESRTHILETCFFIGIFLIVFFVRTLFVHEASAGTQFFQAWNPLYVKYIMDNGTFYFDSREYLKDGFLISGSYYAPNTFGLVLLSGFFLDLSVKDLFYFYNALNALSVVYSFYVALYFVRNKHTVMPQVIFFVTVILFLFLDGNVRLWFSSNASEELFFLPLLLSTYYLYIGILNENKKKFVLAIVFCSFSVHGRNYGLFFLLCYAVLYFLLFYRATSRSKQLIYLFKDIKAYWPAVIVIFVIVSKEVGQILIHGLRFPRQNVVDIYSYTLESFLGGGVSSFSIGYFKGGYYYNPASVYLLGLLLIFLFVTYLSRMNEVKIDRKMVFLFFFPVLTVLIPLLLEVTTQYRKNVYFSKLYIHNYLLFIMFPSFMLGCFSNIYIISNFHKKGLKYYTGLYLFFMSISLIFMFHKPGIRHSSIEQGIKHTLTGVKNRMNSNTLYLRHEEGLLEQIKESYTEEQLEEIINNPVIYMYYEPGLTFRYFFGGDFSNDIDFWSPAFIRLLNDEGSFKNAICRLGKANILAYHVNGDFLKYNKFNGNVISNEKYEKINEFLKSDKVIELASFHDLTLYTTKYEYC
ncbi:hypothetical protein EJ063_15275 [Vibrio aquaticus]|uniref:Uncharacterized protein n=1 Tax=Vibrio aquaticus TaxID=2496559 RepID=A0A3S0Q0K1_9VIBR|nr:hypothetical protein [Vibrio aquaticus]RTZ14671.1 hypothetical protein EJ063_15275 [Vibrio aquaticus]